MKCDYIVLGAGSAEAIVAARLTEVGTTDRVRNSLRLLAEKVMPHFDSADQ